jgi:hypothetical protein
VPFGYEVKMKIKNRKSVPANEFRKNKVTKHPAYIFEKEGHYYKNIGITHSQKTNDEDNIPLDRNPDPNDNRQAYVRPFPEQTRAERFSKKLDCWELHETDKEKIKDIKKRRFRP